MKAPKHGKKAEGLPLTSARASAPASRVHQRSRSAMSLRALLASLGSVAGRRQLPSSSPSCRYALMPFFTILLFYLALRGHVPLHSFEATRASLRGGRGLLLKPTLQPPESLLLLNDDSPAQAAFERSLPLPQPQPQPQSGSGLHSAAKSAAAAADTADSSPEPHQAVVSRDLPVVSYDEATVGSELPAPAQEAAAGAAAASELVAAEMAACMADESTAAQQLFTVDDFLQGHTARLQPRRMLLSQVLRPQYAVTMVLTATPSRLHLLDDLCRSWPAPMSVALYVSIRADDPGAAQSLDTAVDDAAAAFDRLEALKACQVDLVLYSEAVANKAAAELFPINALRNAALLMARTDMIMLGNIDMLVGAGLAEELTDPSEYKSLLALAQQNKIVVVAAFEADKLVAAHQAAQGGKSEVAAMWRSQQVQFFRERDLLIAHNDTDFPRWTTALKPYRLQDVNKMYFEPWYIMARRHETAYDVRFRGYGRNKVQHALAQVTVFNSSYVVHPRAFFVHRPHGNSAAKNVFMSRTTLKRELAEGAPTLRQATEELYTRQRIWGTNFRPRVTTAFARCRDSLSWWQDSALPGDGLPAISLAVASD